MRSRPHLELIKRRLSRNQQRQFIFGSRLGKFSVELHIHSAISRDVIVHRSASGARPGLRTIHSGGARG